MHTNEYVIPPASSTQHKECFEVFMYAEIVANMTYFYTMATTGKKLLSYIYILPQAADIEAEA